MFLSSVKGNWVVLAVPCGFDCWVFECFYLLAEQNGNEYSEVNESFDCCVFWKIDVLIISKAIWSEIFVWRETVAFAGGPWAVNCVQLVPNPQLTQ